MFSIGHSLLVNLSTASLRPLAARGAGLVTGVNPGCKEIKEGRRSIVSIKIITILVFKAPRASHPKVVASERGRGGGGGGVKTQNAIISILTILLHSIGGLQPIFRDTDNNGEMYKCWF